MKGNLLLLLALVVALIIETSKTGENQENYSTLSYSLASRLEEESYLCRVLFSLSLELEALGKGRGCRVGVFGS